MKEDQQINKASRDLDDPSRDKAAAKGPHTTSQSDCNTIAEMGPYWIRKLLGGEGIRLVAVDVEITTFPARVLLMFTA